MKILGMLAINDRGVFQVLPLVGMPEIKEVSGVDSSAKPPSEATTEPLEPLPSGVLVPRTPEMDKISKEVEKPKSLDEVLEKNKR